jgi:predicted sugar kinase
MNTKGTGFYTCKECHKTESIQNRTATVHREREQLGDRRNVGESSCNSGDGMNQKAQPLMIMMMMMAMIEAAISKFGRIILRVRSRFIYKVFTKEWCDFKN